MCENLFFGLSVFAPRREVHMARIWAELLRLFEPRSSPPPRAADCNSSELVALTAGGEPLKRDEWAEFLQLDGARCASAGGELPTRDEWVVLRPPKSNLLG